MDDGSIVCDWRSTLTNYSKLPGIRSLHDFIFAKNSIDNTVVAKVRKSCFNGSLENTTMHVATGRDINENVIPCSANKNYQALTNKRSLTESKFAY